MIIKRLHHIGIAVENIDAAIEFYCDFIGCTLNSRFFMDGGVEIAQLQFGDEVIEFLSFPDYKDRSTKGIIDHFSFEVEGIEDVLSSVRAMGFKVTEELVIIPEDVKLCFFEGPNGERIELKEFIN